MNDRGPVSIETPLELFDAVSDRASSRRLGLLVTCCSAFLLEREPQPRIYRRHRGIEWFEESEEGFEEALLSVEHARTISVHLDRYLNGEIAEKRLRRALNELRQRYAR